ncbi:hypothetical protein [Mycobacterium sp.]|uniref:hypothetical protein n=1 Tax=Mycobacterium sp. TaxID=1785 RepID=UPI002C9FDBC3|nr:hypothetical protein [Mycobacterium sp.]HTY35403.1 hypothetical protein [Mycobacterium sp.]
MKGTYERTADGRTRYIPPAGSRGVDRVPARLRDLAPSVAVDELLVPAPGLSGGRVLTRRVDPGARPEWHPKVGVTRTARAVHRTQARQQADADHNRLRQIAAIRTYAAAILASPKDVADVVRLLGPTDAAWALRVRVEDLADLAGAA